MTSGIQTGQTGKIRLIFKLDFPGHLCRSAFVIIAMFHFCGGGSNPLSQVVWSSLSKSLTSLLRNLGRRKSGDRERPRGLNCPNISWKLQNLIKISPVCIHTECSQKRNTNVSWTDLLFWVLSPSLPSPQLGGSPSGHLSPSLVSVYQHQLLQRMKNRSQKGREAVTLCLYLQLIEGVFFIRRY